MKCRKLHKNLIFFLEGGLPQSRMEEIAEHLSGCAECAAFTEDMKITLGIVQMEKQVPVSPYFYTRLKARMERQQDAIDRKTAFPLWEKVLQPAMFSLLLMAGLYTGVIAGSYAGKTSSGTAWSTEAVIPFLDEMESEPLETFLME